MTKNTRLTTLLCLLMMFLMNSCLFEVELETEGKPTEMVVSVLDSAGNSLPNVPVVLYRSLVDFESRTAIVAADTTDAEGKAYFSRLESADYWFYTFYAKNGKVFDNSRANYHLSDILIEGSVTNVTLKTFYSRPVTPAKVTITEACIFKFTTKNLLSTDSFPDPVIAMYERQGASYTFMDHTDSMFNFVNNGYTPAVLKFKQQPSRVAGANTPMLIDMYNLIPSYKAVDLFIYRAAETAHFNLAKLTQPDLTANRRLPYPKRVRIREDARAAVVDLILKWE